MINKTCLRRARARARAFVFRESEYLAGPALGGGGTRAPLPEERVVTEGLRPLARRSCDPAAQRARSPQPPANTRAACRVSPLRDNKRGIVKQR